MQEKKLTPQQAQEVIREAVRLQQAHDEKIDAQTLETSAAEIGVDPQHLREALRRIEQEQVRRAQRRKTFVIALAVVAALLIINLLASQRALNAAWAEVNLRRAQLQNVQQRQANLLPRLEQLTQQANAQQRERLQLLIDAIRNNPDAVQILAAQLASDPSLRNDWLIVRLMDEIAGSENRIAIERKRYAEAVARYEQTANRFPINLARPLLGYPKQIK